MPYGPTIHTTMEELLERWPSARARLARHGMACVGCPMARFDTLGEAAIAYGLDPFELLREVRGRARKSCTASHAPRSCHPQ